MLKIQTQLVCYFKGQFVIVLVIWNSSKKKAYSIYDLGQWLQTNTKSDIANEIHFMRSDIAEHK
jgi:hypothetical protein